MVRKISFGTTVATFGAAMASLYVTPELQADIVDITWNGGNATATNPFIGTFYNAPPATLNIDQVTGGTAGDSQDFFQFNFGVAGSNRTIELIPGGNIVSLNEVASGDFLDADAFTGLSTLGAGGEFNGTGSNFIAFRSANGNVGWFQITHNPGILTYGVGEYGSGGESLTVGGTIPEPSSAAVIALLAVGATTSSRRRS